jgi:hypothetical protein
MLWYSPIGGKHSGCGRFLYATTIVYVYLLL